MFSQTGEYALRAVAYIAQHDREGPVLAKGIAAGADIPRRYLQKVLTDLVRVGVLKSSRGIGGGFRLSNGALDMTVAQVIAPFGDLARRTECPLGHINGGKALECPAHEGWSEVVRAYDSFVHATKLSGLVLREGRQGGTELSPNLASEKGAAAGG